MGYKKVCFNCRKSFSVYKSNADDINLTCPECGKQSSILHHLFKPPKQNELNKWKVIEFLKDHGFVYQHVYAVYTRPILSGQLHYPETMEEAKEFVVKYKAQACQFKWDSALKDFVSTKHSSTK